MADWPFCVLGLFTGLPGGLVAALPDEVKKGGDAGIFENHFVYI